MKKAIGKNNNDLFDEIITALNEATAYAKGDKKAARKTKMEIRLVTDYTSKDIKRIRTDLHLSQCVFAEVMGVSTKTVEAWESVIIKTNGFSSQATAEFRSESCRVRRTAFGREFNK